MNVDCFWQNDTVRMFDGISSATRVKGMRVATKTHHPQAVTFPRGLQGRSFSELTPC